MKHFMVKSIPFGVGAPKICIQIKEKTHSKILSKAQEVEGMDCDLIELRADFFEHLDSKSGLLSLLEELRDSIQKPMLFSIRTKATGGEADLSLEKLDEIYSLVIENGLTDMIELSYLLPKENLTKLIQLAKYQNIYTMVSHYDREKTPSSTDLTSIFTQMQALDCHMTKLVTTPNSEEDVLSLMGFALKAKKELATFPFVIHSIKDLGITTRICGELTGSCMTYGAIKAGFTTGDIPATKLRQILNILHIK